MAAFAQILLLLTCSTSPVLSYRLEIEERKTIISANAREKAVKIHSEAAMTPEPATQFLIDVASLTYHLQPYQLDKSLIKPAHCGFSGTEGQEEMSNKFSTLIASAQDKENLFIFDWDDTLFPTSWAKKTFKGPKTMQQDGGTSLQVLNQKVTEVIRKATETGIVAIISNGGSRWLEDTQKLFPEIEKMVSARTVVSISTEKIGKDERKEHRKQCFYSCLKEFLEPLMLGRIKKVVQFGDKDKDLAAAKALEVTDQIYVRGMKLLDGDHGPEVFAKELDLIYLYLGEIEKFPESSRMYEVVA